MSKSMITTITIALIVIGAGLLVWKYAVSQKVGPLVPQNEIDDMNRGERRVLFDDKGNMITDSETGRVITGRKTSEPHTKYGVTYSLQVSAPQGDPVAGAENKIMDADLSVLAETNAGVLVFETPLGLVKGGYSRSQLVDDFQIVDDKIIITLKDGREYQVEMVHGQVVAHK